MENNQPKKNYNKWLALINIPIQMGVIIFVFNKIGVWLDSNYTNEKVYYYKIFTILGVFISLYNVYRQVNQINKNA
ncbi:AtpZ/AtpI family protein [Flavobacterium sp.]|uniref:AtpZ/AtpI family protein n=1 Tax=Flavobacterium sp. TaxID=239 RepID=UPI00286C47FF|nr:AtpZ/AtpI family protein [Flavobacterium sp.]